MKREKQWQIDARKQLESFKREAARTGRPLPEVIDERNRATMAAAGDEPITVICALSGTHEHFLDDLLSLCSYCGRTVHHRPFVPKNAIKVCLDCGNKLPETVD